jgi:putative methyltransferase
LWRGLQDPHEEPYCRVSAIQLDPTCSGSGMVERDAYQIGEAHGGAADGAQSEGTDERVRALGAMQLELLKHAMTFPRARVVVYSTCSVHPIEDELVVAAALADAAVAAAGWRLAPALPSWPMRGLPLVDGAEMLVRAGPEAQTNGFFVARFERDVPA